MILNKFWVASFLLPCVIWGGSYNITPSNYTTSGLAFSLDNTQLLTTTKGIPYFSIASMTNNQLEINGFNIRPGYTWSTVSLTIGNGSVVLTIRDFTGTPIVDSTTVSTGTHTFDLSETEAAKKSRRLVFSITFNSTSTQLNSIIANYSGAGIFVYPSPYTISQGLANLSYDLPNDGLVTLAIYDNRGRLVKQIYNHVYVAAKSSSKETDKWDGRNSAGSKVASGIYTVYISVQFLNNTNTTEPDYTSSFRFVVLR